LSSRVGPLVLFGFTLIAGGMYWMLWDSSREYLDNLLINDVYYQLIYWGWRVIPAILIFVGIMCLLSAGLTHSRERGVEY